ncbi:MAG: PAS domain-containing protein [Halopenitus sp.]
MERVGRNQLNNVLGEVTRALLPATTEPEIRQRVCDELAATESYSSAWIGRYSPETAEVIPAASAGVAAEKLERISITDESFQAELANEAVRKQEVAVERNPLDNPSSEEPSSRAFPPDCEVFGFIPLVHDEQLHGVLHLTTDRPQGFGTEERDALAELGLTIACAFENSETPSSAIASGSTEAEPEPAIVSPKSERERRLYETIVSSTPDLIYAFDLNYRVIYANDALLEMWGQTYEESIGKTLLELGYEPWHAEMHEREIDQVVETKEPVRGEVAFQHAEKGRRTYDYIFAPVRNDDGEVEAIAGTTRDVTERKEAEQELQESKDRFRALVTASSDALYRMSPDWTEMYQLEGQEFIADTEEPTNEWLEKYIHPDDREYVMETVNESIRTKSVFELEHRVERPDGSLGWTFSRAVPRLDEDDEVIEWVGMAKDVTERKEYEQELERALDLLEKTERLADVGGWEIDVDTRDLFWTDNVFDILEVSENEEPSIDDRLEFYHDEDRPLVENAVEEALDSGEPFDVEARIRTPDGEIRWLRVQGDPEVETGDVVSLRGAVQDITDRKQREKRLEELIDDLEESNERLEQFARAASHDLQEPLRMVSSYLQLVEDRYGDKLDEEGREFLEFAVDGADRMSDMVQGLLQYSRVDRRGDPFEPVDLDAVIADVREDLQMKIEETDAEITADSLPQVEGDRDQLRQLFQNLLENAIKYSGDDPPRVDVAAEEQGPRWVVSVEDEGIGIDPAYTDQVFEVFESLDSSDEYNGTGIGLALCERIVERHDGDIWVDSEPGDGTTFSFTLPSVESS